MLPRRGRAVEALEDVRRTSSSAIPGPWSRTVSSPSVEPHLDGRAGGAPLGRVVEQVRDRALEARRLPDDRRRREVGLDRHVGVVARRPPDRLLGRRGRAGPPRAASACSSPRASSVSSPISVGHLARAARPRRASSCSRSSGGSASPCASTSMFVRRLVSGVRSSCEASWTSWRWRCCASSSDSSIALKVCASRSRARRVPVDLDPLREVARRAHALGRLAQLAQRLAASPRATRKPATAAIPMPPSGDEQEPEPDLARARCRRRSAWRRPGARPPASEVGGEAAS